jgi:hypothetical protein
VTVLHNTAQRRIVALYAGLTPHITPHLTSLTNQRRSNMKNGNVANLAIAGSAFLSLVSFSAFADTAAPATPQERIHLNAGKQLAAEGNKYADIVSLAGSQEDELTAKRYEAANAYKKWHDVKSAVVKHYPSYRDYVDVEAASKEYSQANKAFIEMQKSILAQNGAPIHNVATKIIAME